MIVWLHFTLHLVSPCRFKHGSTLGAIRAKVAAKAIKMESLLGLEGSFGDFHGPALY